MARIGRFKRGAAPLGVEGDRRKVKEKFIDQKQQSDTASTSAGAALGAII